MKAAVKKEINALANLFYRMQGCQVEASYDFSKAHHPAERSCWNMAKTARTYFDVRWNSHQEILKKFSDENLEWDADVISQFCEEAREALS